MLRIYTVILEVLRELRPVVAAIEVHDRDLGRQLRRAATSVALNCSEGSGSSGGTRRERYRNALGSARETGACLDAAMALGYIEGVDASLLDRLDHVRAVLVRNVLLEATEAKAGAVSRRLAFAPAPTPTPAPTHAPTHAPARQGAPTSAGSSGRSR